MQHEYAYHRQHLEWRCVYQTCPADKLTFLDEDGFRTHMVDQHQLSPNGDSDFLLIGKTCRRVVITNTDANIECPVCLLSILNKRSKIGRHLGRHMEDIALPIISLVLHTDEDSDASDESDDETSLHSEMSLPDLDLDGPALADNGPARPPKQKAWTGGQTPTSYWSVPEQNDFPKYVAHFGKDYVAIANYMQTKTPIMVKNYLLRNVEQGKWELEEMAQQVEEKRQRGEPMGPPPARTMVAKRRYL
jgi:hypothetical protein